jgi:methionine sulfoxide reductase heme-binding subunit
VTPLRRLGDWPVLLRYRRALGLWAFAYACIHLTIYLALDLGGYWAQILDDIVERPFITAGFFAWLLLLPLAATSTRAMIRRLGHGWQRLHRLVYPAAALAVLHLLWLVKADLSEPLIYAAVLALLLALRLPGLRRLQLRPRSARRKTQHGDDHAGDHHRGDDQPGKIGSRDLR